MNRGRACTSRTSPPRTSRFNEAPIHESGKVGRRHDPIGLWTAASMRPRFMNRGRTLKRYEELALPGVLQ